MKKLSIRKRGGRQYEVGMAGRGRSVMISAMDKHEALMDGKRKWRKEYGAA